MLAPAAEDLEVLIDPHAGGEVLFLQDAADKLALVHGVEVLHPTSIPMRSFGHRVTEPGSCSQRQRQHMDRTTSDLVL